MNDPAAAMRAFGQAIEASIAETQQTLAERFARHLGSEVQEIAWSEWSNGDYGVMVTLTNGRSLFTRAAGRLDALADFEDALRSFEPGVSAG